MTCQEEKVRVQMDSSKSSSHGVGVILLVMREAMEQIKKEGSMGRVLNEGLVAFCLNLELQRASSSGTQLPF